MGGRAGGCGWAAAAPPARFLDGRGSTRLLHSYHYTQPPPLPPRICFHQLLVALPLTHPPVTHPGIYPNKLLVGSRTEPVLPSHLSLTHPPTHPGIYLNELLVGVPPVLERWLHRMPAIHAVAVFLTGGWPLSGLRVA